VKKIKFVSRLIDSRLHDFIIVLSVLHLSQHLVAVMFCVSLRIILISDRARGESSVVACILVNDGAVV